ncbi:hypothetical protein NOVOSPHI9U_170006 [Novosphingobium sp. 9U]|nr:hypothetical protein NOVOSPHI9U_170006 [Novosphingobium sp. 9U]
MRVLHPVTGSAANLLLITVAQLVHCGTLRAKPIGGDSFRRSMASERFLHESRRSRPYLPDLTNWCTWYRRARIAAFSRG